MSDLSDWTANGIAIAALVFSLYNFFQARNAVRIELPHEDHPIKGVRVVNLSPHAVTIDKLGLILPTGKLVEDIEDDSYEKVRVDARDSAAVPIGQNMKFYHDFLRNRFGRVGWYIQLATGEIYYSHSRLERWVWAFLSKVTGVQKRLDERV
ncbi:hypothetical protein HBN82_24280 [Pseudomonas lundensis]|uniref:hypothetical protein n=1 Tax=Pseudomonas lundensis TaxID=86185 RepID=UPI001474F306|nr:hypothetical protein [Pseudomonas lundensis]NNA18963.1 hypothetical protein [Pseudomonas lundensis]